MASIQIFIAIEAPRDHVLALIRDRAQRERFLPDGWRVLALLTDDTSDVGSRMEVEWRMGASPTTHVIELLAVAQDEGGIDVLIEGPPEGDNYVATWRVGADAAATLVGLHFDFEYGDWIGEFFVRRRLNRALRQMLLRLKQVAEAYPLPDGSSVP